LSIGVPLFKNNISSECNGNNVADANKKEEQTPRIIIP